MLLIIWLIIRICNKLEFQFFIYECSEINKKLGNEVKKWWSDQFFIYGYNKINKKYIISSLYKIICNINKFCLFNHIYPLWFFLYIVCSIISHIYIIINIK